MENNVVDNTSIVRHPPENGRISKRSSRKEINRRGSKDSPEQETRANAPLYMCVYVYMWVAAYVCIYLYMWVRELHVGDICREKE